ncbi:MAG: hypothetical protein JWN93_3897 [Hyphomicrobiales bacterium]|nr:hypothetical protein [Hyphomicrobiales bacterium]
MLRNPALPMLARARAFNGCRSGLAALEFALVIPMLFVILFGGAELLRYMNVAKRVQNAAIDIGQMISANSSSISGADLWELYQTVPILVPDVRVDAVQGARNWYSQAAMNVSFLQVAKNNPACTSNCAFTAQVAWAYGRSKRACGTLSQSSSSSFNVKELPDSFFTDPTNLISVEMAYTYQPIFGTLFAKALRINRTFFIAPRYVDYISLTQPTAGGGGITGANCAGF